MKRLILTVGLPYSGKSTWARQQKWPIVCPDEIRRALHGERYIQRAEPFVWAIAHIMVRALFLAGHDTVILDACNTTAKRRIEWTDEDWAVHYQPFPADLRTCIRRAREADDGAIIPVIERMADQLEWPWPQYGRELA